MNQSIAVAETYPESQDPGVSYWQNKNKKNLDFLVPDVPKNKGDVIEYRVRLVPNPHNEVPIPISELYLHYDLGDKQGIVCPLRSMNKPCAICEYREHNQKIMKELCDQRGIVKQDFKRPNPNTPSRVEQIPEINDVWIAYKDLYPKKRGYISLIIRGQEDQGVKFLSVGEKLLENIIDRIGAAEKMVDRYRGYDAIIKVKNVGKFFNGKPNGEIDFQFDAFGERKPILPGRPAEEIDALINTVKDISTIVPIPTYEQTQAAVAEYLTWLDNKNNKTKGE
jgi:hypothetical protein